MRRQIIIYAAALVLVGVFVIPVVAQKEYTLRIDVRAADGGSVAGTTVTIWGQVAGSQIFDVRSASVLDRGQYGAIFTLDEMGFALVFLAPGTYKATVKNKFYKEKTIYISVPIQGQEGQMTQSASVTLEKDEKDVSRRLTVTVLGETRDGSGRTTTAPVPNAKVEISSQETESLYRGKTDASGVAVFDEPFVIGTEVKVSATADGWDGQQRSLIIGSRQEIDPKDRRTTTSDQTVLKLWKKVKEPTYSLVVQVVNAQNGTPVSGASVEIELIELAGLPFATGTTNATGQTKPFDVPPLLTKPDSQKHADMRIKVKAKGFKDKWNDIPYEIPYMSTTGRNYLVQLEPLPKTEDSGTSGQVWNPYDLPAQFKTKAVQRIQKLESYECWAPPNAPCTQPSIELSITVYYFVGGGSYWDRREYDRKRRAQADAGLVFSWACDKALWRNGRCG